MFSVFLLFPIIFFVLIITNYYMADLNNNLTGSILDPFAHWYTDFGHILSGRQNWVSLRRKCFVNVNLDISCKNFCHLAFQRSVQHICETLDTFNRSFDSFYSQLALAWQTDKQTNEPKVQAPKRHYWGWKNNFSKYFSTIGSAYDLIMTKNWF